jgi:lysophospholipase L1-like esterase
MPALMRRAFIVLNVLSLLPLMIARAETGPERAAIRGVPRTDQNSRIAHEQMVAKARQGRIDLYFAGDSITRRWGSSDAQYADLLANWKENFFGWNAGNFGWGGDTVQNVLWRLENGELDGVHPKVVVVMAGTNNLGSAPAPVAGDGSDRKVEEIVAGIRAILDLVRAKAPAATVVLMGITPRNDGDHGRGERAKVTAATIARINERIAELADDGRKVRYLNINDRLADANGKLSEGVTLDGLHLSVKGYQVWADALKPVLTEILGPPAKTDLAPPPTGDPSASKP